MATLVFLSELPLGIHITALRVQNPYTLEAHGKVLLRTRVLELIQLSSVHTLWAGWRHPYIESTNQML